MSTPLAIQYVTLTGRWVRVDGSPASGHVRIASWRTVTSGVTDTVISVQPIEYPLDDDGGMSVRVPITVQDAVPDSIYVEVHVLLADTRPESLLLRIPGDTELVDIADAERVPMLPEGPEPPVVPLVAWSSVGEPGGVAPLDGSGLVPSRYLPAGSGGTASEAIVFGYGPPPTDLVLTAGQMYIDQESFLVYR
ncbi:hypothetical protein [Saccharopolyspora tripterygii]